MEFYQRHRHTIGIFFICFLLNDKSMADNKAQNVITTKATIEPEGRALFNSRVDYNNNNQWMPVGHSDPLKNDPTFDYSPPTLDRVRYWHENNDENNSNNVNPINVNNNLNEKSEILLLGVPIKHTLYPQTNHHTNQLSQTDEKSNNRRSSAYYPPEPSRVLTPPPMQSDQIAYSSEFNYPSNYWNNELSALQTSDSYTDESASYLTVIKPKTNVNPYLMNFYNKDAHDSVHNLAANINSLESSDKRNAWIQSLLQKEINYQPPSTTPQVVLAYSPQIFVPKSKDKSMKQITSTTTESTTTSFTSTTVVPTTLTTDAFFSHYKQPILPVRGPMYLIIQGHSKVKTYGVDKNDNKITKNEPKMVPVVSTEPVVKHVVSENANSNIIQVKHLHKTRAPELKTKTTLNPNKGLINSSMDSLLSLLDSSLGFSFGGTKLKSSSELKNSLNDTKRYEKNANKPIISTITGPTTVRPTSNIDLNS